jgi:biopolymer transport protein ExbD
MARERKKKSNKAEDLDLLPVMNLFSILIPFLISVAVFQKLAIVEVTLPKRSDMVQNQDEPPPPDDQALNLTVAITPDYLQIVARGGMLPMIFIKEMWTFRCQSDGDTITHDPKVLKAENKEPTCRDGSTTDQYEIATIHQWVLQKESEEDPGKILTALYNKNDSVYLDGNNDFVKDRSSFKVGDVYATLAESSARKIDADAFNKAKVKPLSAWDDLAKTLIGIHNRFIDAPDADNIIILADDAIQFDKVINAMDRAREAGFWKISLAKLGGA